MTKVAKSGTITCQPGALQAGVLEESMALKYTGVGDSYQVILQRRITCPECGVEITAGYMTVHCRHMHGTDPAIDWSRLPVIHTEHQPQVYDVSLPRATNRCPCPSCLTAYYMWNGLCL